MSIRIKMGAGESYLENKQIEARLDALGIKLNPDRTIDESSAANLAGGLDAVKALAQDGVITADALSQLRRQVGFLGQITGKSLPISEKQTNAWRALGMELTGTAGTLTGITAEIRRAGSINNSQFHRAGERLEALEKRLGDLSVTEPSQLQLAQVAPDALQAVATGAKALSAAVSEYQQTLSLFRSAMVDKLAEAHGPKYRLETGKDGSHQIHERPGWFTRVQINAIGGSLLSALEGLPTWAKVGRLLSEPIGSESAFARSAPAATKPKLDLGAAVDQAPGRKAIAEIEKALGSDPMIFPGSVGRAFEKRMPEQRQALFRAVLDAAAGDLVAKKLVSNSYGQIHEVSQVPKHSDPNASVPRPIFRGALEKTLKGLATVLDALPAKPTAAEVEAKASQMIDEAHYAPAIAALYRSM